MGSIYKALMRATEERQAIRRLTGLAETDRPARRVDGSDANEDLVDLIASIESLPALPRKKTIQFLGSHDGTLSAALARRFAEACADSLGLPVLFVEPGDPEKRKDGLSFLDPVSDRLMASRRFKDLDDLIRPAQAKNLCTCPSSALTRLWSGLDSPEGDETAWLRTRERFDLIVVGSAPTGTSAESCAIDPRVDAVILVFESETTDAESSSREGGLCLATVLEQIAMGLWCPNHTLSCLDTPLLLLTRPSAPTCEPGGAA
jgi:hypothetical protein